MNKDDFKIVSLRGRVAFGVRCFENVLLALDYNVDGWKKVLEYLWEFTSINYLDDWSGIISEIIPECLLEFNTYQVHIFDYIDEETFKYLYNLYQNIDEKIDFVMTSIFDIGTSHAYTSIKGYGQESLDEIGRLIDYMTKNKISLPDIEIFEEFSIAENKGLGNKFDGKKLSCIL